MNKSERKNNRISLTVIIAGVIFSFVTAFVFAFGRSYDKTDNIVLTDYYLWLSFILFFSVSFGLSILFNNVIVKTVTLKTNSFEKRSNKTLKILFIVLPAIMWILALLACFPGVFSYDCYEEWQMVASGNLSTHHPLMHVLILGGLTELSVMLTQNGNLGIAVYVILQMIFALFVLNRVYDFTSSKIQSRIISVFSLLFYSFSPIIQLFVIATTKDSIFAFFELWFLINCFKIQSEKKVSKILWIEFAISILGTLVFRKNGVYIVIPAMIMFIIVASSLRRKLILLFVSLMFIYSIYVFVPLTFFNVAGTKSAEMLSVPMQQMTRVYYFEKDELTKEEEDEITRFIPKSYLEKYIPTTADSVKLGFDSEEFDYNKIDFFKIWLKLGVKHPMSYINAFLVNTVDLWYPLAVNDGYRWLYGNDETKSDFFDYRVAEPGNQIVLNKPFNIFYEYISTSKKITANPVASFFLNPGWCLLMWVCLLLKSIFRKDKKLLVFHTAMGMSILTVLFGPMSMIRYVLIFYLTVPIELLFLFVRDNKEKIISE